MFTEDDFQPISALQHLAFCERQWGLIHIERIWLENVLTMEGRHLHEKVHEEETENRGDLRTARSLRLRSTRLGLTGQADVVEFKNEGDDNILVTPVEFKRGKPKIDSCDEIQLCAQALCLEEMLNTKISEGYFFYGKPRRRHRVEFTVELRNKTEDLTKRLHQLFLQNQTPIAKYEKKCDSCSLFEICMPKITQGKSVKRYLSNFFRETADEHEGAEDS